MLRFLPLLLILLAGCGPASPPAAAPQPAAARDSVLALIRTLPQDALRQAFARLGSVPHVQERTAEEYVRDRLRARSEHVVRVQAGGQPVVLRADSTGAFQEGTFGGLGGARSERTPADFTSNLLPEEPEYMNPRHFEGYTYHALPDTILEGRLMRRIEVQAKPGEKDISLRRVRYHVDAATGALAALHVEREARGLLLREQSDFYVALQPAQGGWLPAITRFSTVLELPLRPRRQLVSHTRFAVPEGGISSAALR